MLNDWTLAAGTSAIARGEITSEALVRACLDRIAAREAVVGAWAWLDPEHALAQARACDAMPPRGPLHGAPIGIKDIVDTVDMPTAHGCAANEGARPASDAACVALLREAGAVILGKTVTTEYAALTPGKTANPRNVAHSPGGSSSGSAAAVADRMVPAALGTQTVGSTIRPATFCGAVGFKPTFGTFCLRGIMPQAPSLDTLGLLTRSVDDVLLLSAALLGVPEAFDAPALRRPPRLAFCETPHWPKAEASTLHVMAQARAALTAEGATIEPLALPQAFDQLLDAQWTILKFEFARVMTTERTLRREALSARLQGLLDDGMRVPAREYHAARAHAEACRTVIAPMIESYDAVLTPAAAGEAPIGIHAVSDLLFQRLWTALHLPAITLPGYTGATGLPVGIQIVGAHGNDGHLLAVARWVEARMPGLPAD